jgi:hypothetical protein
MVTVAAAERRRGCAVVSVLAPVLSRVLRWVLSRRPRPVTLLLGGAALVWLAGAWLGPGTSPVHLVAAARPDAPVLAAPPDQPGGGTGGTDGSGGSSGANGTDGAPKTAPKESSGGSSSGTTTNNAGNSTSSGNTSGADGAKPSPTARGNDTGAGQSGGETNAHPANAPRTAQPSGTSSADTGGEMTARPANTAAPRPPANTAAPRPEPTSEGTTPPEAHPVRQDQNTPNQTGQAQAAKPGQAEPDNAPNVCAGGGTGCADGASRPATTSPDQRGATTSATTSAQARAGAETTTPTACGGSPCADGAHRPGVPPVSGAQSGTAGTAGGPPSAQTDPADPAARPRFLLGQGGGNGATSTSARGATGGRGEAPNSCPGGECAPGQRAPAVPTVPPAGPSNVTGGQGGATNTGSGGSAAAQPGPIAAADTENAQRAAGGPQQAPKTTEQPTAQGRGPPTPTPDTATAQARPVAATTAQPTDQQQPDLQLARSNTTPQGLAPLGTPTATPAVDTAKQDENTNAPTTGDPNCGGSTSCPATPPAQPNQSAPATAAPQTQGGADIPAADGSGGCQGGQSCPKLPMMFPTGGAKGTGGTDDTGTALDNLDQHRPPGSCGGSSDGCPNQPTPATPAPSPSSAGGGHHGAGPGSGPQSGQSAAGASSVDPNALITLPQVPGAPRPQDATPHIGGPAPPRSTSTPVSTDLPGPLGADAPRPPTDRQVGQEFYQGLLASQGKAADRLRDLPAGEINKLAAQGPPRTAEDALNVATGTKPAAPGTLDELRRRQAIQAWFADSREHPADFARFAAALPYAERVKLEQAFEDNKPGDISKPGGLSYWGRQATKAVTAFNDWAAQHVDPKYTPGSWPDIFQNSLRNAINHAPADLATAADHLLTEDEARSGNPHFQPLPGETPEQAEQRLHPHTQDLNDMARGYADDLGPIVTRGDLGPLANKFHQDPVNTILRYAPAAKPLTAAGRRLASTAPAQAAVSGLKNTTDRAAGLGRRAAKPAPSSEGAAQTGRTTERAGGTPTTPDPQTVPARPPSQPMAIGSAGQRPTGAAATRPGGRPTQRPTGAAGTRPGPTTGIIGRRPGGTTDSARVTTGPNKPLVTAWAGQRGSAGSRESRNGTPKSPSVGANRSGTRDRSGISDEPGLTRAGEHGPTSPGASSHDGATMRHNPDDVSGEPRPVPSEDRTSVIDRAKVLFWDGSEKIAGFAKKLGSRDRAGDSWPTVPARPKPKPTNRADQQPPTAVVGDAATQTRDAANRLLRAQEGSAHTDLADTGQMLHNIADELGHVSGGLGEAGHLAGGTADRLLGTGEAAARPKAASEPAPIPPLDRSQTKHTFWPLDDPRPPPDWKGGKWPPDNLPPTVTQRPTTSINDVIAEVNKARDALPDPEHLRNAAGAIELAGEHARFAPGEFSMDRANAGEMMRSTLGPQLRDIADNIELAQARIDTALERLNGSTRAGEDAAAAGSETFYRGMSHAEHQGLLENGGLSVRGESFVTQDLAYIEQLAARHPGKYETIVQFQMKPGTRQALLDSGYISRSKLLTDKGLGDLPPIMKGMKDVVHIKGEIRWINYGLRPGSAHIFNGRILDFWRVR